MPSMPRPSPPWKVRRSILYPSKYLAYKRNVSKGIRLVPGSACYFQTWSQAMDYATHDGWFTHPYAVRREVYAQA